MKVVWTRQAQNRLAEILGYIEAEFGTIRRESFRSKVKDFTALLSEFPEMGTLEVKDKNLRGFQITRQTRVFYRLKGKTIIILTLFDSRQDPKKKPK